MTTRSLPLALGITNGAGWQILARVAAGVVAIVKDARLLNLGPEPHQIVLEVHDVAAGVSARLLNVTLANSETADWAGWIVAHADSEISVYCTGSGVHVWISGAELPVPF